MIISRKKLFLILVENIISHCCSHILLIFTDNKQSDKNTAAHGCNEEDHGNEHNIVTPFDEMLPDT